MTIPVYHYVPPNGTKVNFTFTDAYIPPAADSILFDFSIVPIRIGADPAQISMFLAS